MTKRLDSLRSGDDSTLHRELTLSNHKYRTWNKYFIAKYHLERAGTVSWSLFDPPPPPPIGDDNGGGGGLVLAMEVPFCSKEMY